MSELSVPNEPFELGAHSVPDTLATSTSEYEAFKSFVLFRLDDSSMSSDEISAYVKSALVDHFTLADFRKKDSEDIVFHILYSVLADAKITATDSYAEVLKELKPEDLTPEETRILLQTDVVRSTLTNEAVRYIESFSGTANNMIQLIDVLEDFAETHGLYDSNVLRMFAELRKLLPGRSNEIIRASRVVKTMMYQMYQDDSLAEPR